MKPHDLIKSAKVLLKAEKGKPSQVNLRRSISTAYYAMFHCLARQSADLLVGVGASGKSKPAWRQVYRALEHKAASNACKDNIINKFPDSITDFANLFIAMQEKRHSADYDPFVSFTRSEVIQDIATIELAISNFEKESTKDRRAFCAFILFKKRA
jgi:uncharacterized protein (UPF0332 family)